MLGVSDTESEATSSHHNGATKLLDEYVEIWSDFYESSEYEEWRNGSLRLLTCYGEPRSGKTSFAAALARKLLEEGESVVLLHLGHGSLCSDPIQQIRQVQAPTMLIVDGLDWFDDVELIQREIAQIAVQTILIHSKLDIMQDNECQYCEMPNNFTFYRNCVPCGRRYCESCELCAHGAELEAAHMVMEGLDTYVEERISPSQDAVKDMDEDQIEEVREMIVSQAEGSFVKARLLVEEWLRFKSQAIFDTKDHIFECQIEFYSSLLHDMSDMGMLSLALAAATYPVRFDELADAIYILTGQNISVAELLRESHHLIDVQLRQVPIIEFSHRDVLAFLREEAELPAIDLVELCRLCVEHEHDGPFTDFALRRWSEIGNMEENGEHFPIYLNHFEKFRARTFRALNDDIGQAKFYGTHSDHLRAWHGLETTSKIPDQVGNLPIHIAASRGHDHVVKRLPRDARDRHNRTAFQVALEHSQFHVCEMLQEESSSQAKYTNDDLDGLHTAIRRGEIDIVAKFPENLRDEKANDLIRREMPQLLDGGSENTTSDTDNDNDNSLSGEDLEHCSIEETNPLSKATTLDECRGLLEYANTVDKQGQTPLWRAIDAFDHDRVKLMLPKADLDIIDNDGNTAINHAWSRRNYEAVWEMFPLVDLKTEYLHKWLKEAIEHDLLDVVKDLVRKGADIFQYATGIGRLPSETVARRRSSAAMVELVKDMEEGFIRGDKLETICA